jgi:hypothetical protein
VTLNRDSLAISQMHFKIRFRVQTHGTAQGLPFSRNNAWTELRLPCPRYLSSDHFTGIVVTERWIDSSSAIMEVTMYAHFFGKQYRHDKALGMLGLNLHCGGVHD